MRETFVWRDGKLVPKSEAPPHPLETRPSWQVMRGMEAFESPIDGRVINSRRELLDHNRHYGVIDVGNDKTVFERKKPTRLPSSAEQIKQLMGRL